LDATRIELVSDRHLVTGATLVRRLTDEEGGVDSMRFVFALSEIKLNPDFSKDPFVPSVVIPEGYPVTARGQPGIEHEWRNGEVVKNVNQSSVANLEGNWYQRGTSFGRGSAALLVLALAALGGAYWFWRRARR
jgi:hypothetical protein